MTARSRKRRGKGRGGAGGGPRGGDRGAGAEPSRRPRLRKAAWGALAAVLLVAAWALLRIALPGGPPARPGGTGKLNVLLITMDTTRADYLGCYGRRTARTPNLDRLAREGTLFTRCTTCSPQTLPSHASILTGVYPYVHGARRNGTARLAGANQTLAETLREAGYNTRATVASFVLDRRFGTAQGFDAYHDGKADSLDAERKGDEVREDAVGMLRAPAGEPFFLWVHFFDPHFPYESPRSQAEDSPGAYEDEIAFMDAQIGHLLQEIARLGLERRTLVVAVGDHGEGLGQHEELTHFFFLYETTLRVPLILRCPGTIPAGRRIEAQARTVDIAPTILDLLGLAAWGHAQGVSLVPLLNGEKQDLELAAYGETLEPEALFGLSPLRSLSFRGWKYILAPEPELYHLAGDPGETHNLAAERPLIASRMRERLRTLIAEAPPPPGEEETSVELDPSDVARLESLGYAASGAVAAKAGFRELDRFEPKGGNPRDYARYLRMRSRSSGALRQGDYELSERLIRQLIDAMPDVPHLQVDLANVLLPQDRVDEAMEALGRAAALAPEGGRPLAESIPNLPLVQLNIARALHQAGRLDEAALAFQRALNLAPGSVNARREYGNFLLFATRRYAQAVEQLDIVLKETPNDVDVLHDLGAALSAWGRLERADRILARALSIEPDNVRVLQAAGVLRIRQNRLPEAAEYFSRTLEIEPDSPEARAALKYVRERMQP